MCLYVAGIAIHSRATVNVQTSAAASSASTARTAINAFRSPDARTADAGIPLSVTAKKDTKESSVRNVRTQFKNTSATIAIFSCLVSCSCETKLLA